MSYREAKKRADEYLQHRRFLIAQGERSAGVSPDEAAKRRQTAQRLGVPVQAVNDAPENAVLQEQFDKVWRDTEGLGTLRGKMMQSDFYDVAKDDTGSLGVVEKYARSFADGAVAGTGRILSGTGEFLDAGWRSFLNAGKKLLLPEKGQNANLGRLEGNNFSEGWKAFGEPVKDFSKENIDIPDNQKNFGTNVANGLGQLVPNVLAAFAGGGLGAATSSLGQGADQMAEAVRNDNAPQQNKDLAVLGGAGFTALSEKFALDRMLPKGVGGTVLGRIGTGAAAEGVQETSENLVQDALQKYLTNPEHNIRLGEALEAGGVGATVGAIVTSVAESAAGVRRRRGSRAAAEEHADHLNQQADNAAASKLTARAPDLQADFVNESYGEENNKLFFDAQTLMQSGLADTVAQAMPHLAPQIEAAAATGGMVEMTRGDFHAFLPQETQHHLANIARMSPDAFSAAEAAAWEETEAAAEFEETAKRAHADAEAQLARQQEFDGLKARFKQELAATGRMNAQNADDAASVWASHIQSYAGRLNMTPDEFMGRYGRLNVVGESLTRDGVFSQALASAPPKGWVHVADGAEAAALWNGTSDAQAVFWDMPQGKLAQDVPSLAGYSSVSADKNAINHIRNHHGNADTEAARGQLAVTDGDIARIPEIVGGYDGIRSVDIAGTHNKRVVFAKRFDDGLVVYVAESSVRKKDLKAVSMWKYPQSANAQDALNHAMSLYPTPETEGGVSHIQADDSAAAPLFQDMTAEQAQFAETEAAYGGRL